jgi:hypothetical protein
MFKSKIEMKFEMKKILEKPGMEKKYRLKA